MKRKSLLLLLQLLHQQQQMQTTLLGGRRGVGEGYQLQADLLRELKDTASMKQNSER